MSLLEICSRYLFSSGVSLAFSISFCFRFSSFSLSLSASSLCNNFNSSSSLSLLLDELLLLDRFFFFFLLFLCLDSFLSLLEDLCLLLGDFDLDMCLCDTSCRRSTDRLRDSSRYLLTCFDDLRNEIIGYLITEKFN